jgi:hypothetical protein
VFWMHWHMREIWTDSCDRDPCANREFAVWPRPHPTHLILTDQRLACRDRHGELFSIYWTGLSGCQIDIPAERVSIDYHDGRAGAFTGTAAAVLAVAAVAHLYGTAALLEHPAIRALHRPAPSWPEPGQRRAEGECQRTLDGPVSSV